MSIDTIIAIEPFISIFIHILYRRAMERFSQIHDRNDTIVHFEIAQCCNNFSRWNEYVLVIIPPQAMLAVNFDIKEVH